MFHSSSFPPSQIVGFLSILRVTSGTSVKTASWDEVKLTLESSELKLEDDLSSGAGNGAGVDVEVGEGICCGGLDCWTWFEELEGDWGVWVEALSGWVIWRAWLGGLEDCWDWFGELSGWGVWGSDNGDWGVWVGRLEDWIGELDGCDDLGKGGVTWEVDLEKSGNLWCPSFERADDSFKLIEERSLTWRWGSEEEGWVLFAGLAGAAFNCILVSWGVILKEFAFLFILFFAKLEI